MKKFLGFALCLIICFALGVYVTMKVGGIDFSQVFSSSEPSMSSSTSSRDSLYSDEKNSIGANSGGDDINGNDSSFYDSDGDHKNDNNSLKLSDISLATAKTVIKQSKTNGINDFTSFKDDAYYYFVFDLGTYSNVCVDSPYGYCYYAGMGDVSRKMTASSSSSNTIKNSATNVISNTTTITSTKNLNVKAQFGLPHSIQLNVETGYSRTKGSADTTSWTYSYEEASAYSESEEMSTEICFKNGDEAGWYYYYLSVDLKAYGVIVKDIQSGEFYITVNSSVVGRGFNYVYSKTEGLNLSIDGGLNFDLSIIDLYGLNEINPENYVGTKIDDGKIHVQSIEGLYASLKNAKAEDYVVLDNDIEDCSAYPWMPLDNFIGTLDGCGHSITGFSYVAEKDESSDSMFGMFKQLSGTVKNLNFKKANISVRKYHVLIENIYIGVICGRLTNGKIEGCNILEDSSIYAYHDTDNKKQKTHAYVGGFVGQIEGGEISSCSIENSAVYGRTRINYESNKTEADCWCYTGGIVGFSSGGTIKLCSRYNSTSIFSYATYGSSKSAYHVFSGGIVGYKEGGIVSDCSSTQNNVSFELDACGSKKSANSSNSGHNAICGND